MKTRPIQLMEICGTHTVSIARSGLKQLLPPDVRLLSGPGCPVCVTPPEVIDSIVELSRRPGTVICTYGDMLRVPGTRPDISLLKARSEGARAEMVFSPMDAVELAKATPEREFVFLGVGFETTAPGTLAAVREAAALSLSNFSMLMLLKKVEPAVRALLRDPEARIDGFLCPGHVAVITGAEAFRFLPEEYGLPAVIAGFEPEEIRPALEELIREARENDPRLINLYPRAVSAAGNALALRLMEEMTEAEGALWRGLGWIPDSALRLKAPWRAWDAREKYRLPEIRESAVSACRCGDVICGKTAPGECPFFGSACTPDSPLGPCMVSSEGSCGAAYAYENY